MAKYLLEGVSAGIFVTGVAVSGTGVAYAANHLGETQLKDPTSRTGMVQILRDQTIAFGVILLGMGLVTIGVAGGTVAFVRRATFPPR